MSNVFGSGSPLGLVASNDPGPIQIANAFVSGLPLTVTHARYYVAADLNVTSGGSVVFYAWVDGEPGTEVTGTLTLTGTGWNTAELSPHLVVPAGRRFALALDIGAGSHHLWEAPGRLPSSTGVLTCERSGFQFDSAHLSSVIDEWPADGEDPRSNLLLDVEVAVREMAIVAPDDISAGDEIQVSRVLSGTVNTVTPITDALTVNVSVSGGPLDGTDVDVWVPDTPESLAAAAMTVYRLQDVPAAASLWQASDGSKWAYDSDGIYVCIHSGTRYPKTSLTTRVDTPSLTSWAP